MRSREEKREERRRYEGDAFYEAYRRGVDTDRVSYDAIERAYENDRPPESVARDIQRRDEERRNEREGDEIRQAEAEREYYERQQGDEA